MIETQGVSEFVLSSAIKVLTPRLSFDVDQRGPNTLN